MLTKTALFGGIAAALVICCTPDFTWANLDVDMFDFVYSSTFFHVAHSPGLPLYIVLGWLVTRLPGNDAWNLAFFLSVIPALVTCGLIFYIVNKKTSLKIAPYLATLLFAGAQVAFSQFIIPEIYALETMLLVLTFVLFELRRPVAATVSLGFAMCISWGALILLPIFIWRYWLLVRKTPKVLLGVLPLLLYLYIIPANKEPHLSMGPSTWDAYYIYYAYHPSTLFNLPAWKLPERILLTVMLVVGSLGIGTLLLATILKKPEVRTLLILSIPGVLFFLTTRGQDALVQMIPAVAFVSIAVGVTLHVSVLRKLAVPALLCSLLLLGLNTHFYDIGRTLDSNPTTARQFYNSLDSLDDGTVVSCTDAAVFAGVFLHEDLRPVRPAYVDPDKALSWELDRLSGLKLPRIEHFDPEVGNWPANFDAWAISAARQLDEINPDVEVVVVAAGPDRTIRSPLILYTTDSVPSITKEQETYWYDYVLVYPFAYKNVSGYYAMSENWLWAADTNLTVGIVGMFCTLGLTIGWGMPKVLQKRKYFQKRKTLVGIITASTTLIAIMTFVSILGLAGLPGVRWLE